MTVWLFGDQLNPAVTPLETADHVLLLEAHEFSDRRRYHPQKLTLVFSAMRHARDELRDRGYEVTYLKTETFGDGLDRYFEANPGDHLVGLQSPSHGADDRRRRSGRRRTSPGSSRTRSPAGSRRSSPTATTTRSGTPSESAPLSSESAPLTGGCVARPPHCYGA